MTRYVIAAHVENKYGVLARVTGMFMRKGFNIDSLTVGETENPAYSRITVTLEGDDYAREQLIFQLRKLYNVKNVVLLENGGVERELMLIKVRNTPENRREVFSAAENYRGTVLDCTADNLCVEVTGAPAKISAFVEAMKPFGILEMCRTGVAALERERTLTQNE